VFSAAFEQLRRGKFLDRSAPSTWVIAILNNKVVDYFRKRGRSDALMRSATDHVDSLTAQSSQADQQRRVEVMQALARLTPTERFVLTSTELAGLTYDEVADRLKCPPGTVASTKNRAVKKFREFFTAPHRLQLKGGPDEDV
jgi:RNA polymerase sigma-70 factor (ECF subfamily)